MVERASLGVRWKTLKVNTDLAKSVEIFFMFVLKCLLGNQMFLVIMGIPSGSVSLNSPGYWCERSMVCFELKARVAE